MVSIISIFQNLNSLQIGSSSRLNSSLVFQVMSSICLLEDFVKSEVSLFPFLVAKTLRPFLVGMESVPFL